MMRSWEDIDPWEFLGVSPQASVEEIRAAFESLDRALAPGSLAVYSILDPDEQARLQRQLRVAYQRALRAAGAPEPAPRPEPQAAAALAPTPATAHPLPPAPSGPPPIVAELNGGVEVTGALLRQAREGWGISVETMARRTCIRPQYIVAIDSEDFAALPTRVFARGFVMTYARELRIDPDHAWTCIERRWAAHGPIPRPELSGR